MDASCAFASRAMRESAEAATRARPGETGDREPMALPQDSRTVLLACVFTLMAFYTLYFTSELAVPLCFAVLLKLLLTPGYRILARWRVPGPIAALAMMALLASLLYGLAYGLAGPATDWFGKLPQSLPRLEQHLSLLRAPADRLFHLLGQLQTVTGGKGTASAPAIEGSTLAAYLFTGTRSILTGFGITALLLFFLLVSGDIFMRKLVEILPSFGDKKRAVEMSREVEQNISAYLITITIMNTLVGFATFGAMWAIGLQNPVLWGAIAFVLNYVLILGPLTGLVMFFAVGLLAFPTLLHALLPPAAYLAIHIVEGEVVTPLLVARRFTLNPVLVIGSLIFWDWMWGIPGALLAVPLLATTKIVCDHVRPLMPVGHFLGG
jgi:predicted PurR-regulated permease PerM